MTVLRDQPEILTVEQTATLLQVSKETVYRYIRDGLLLASRIGRGYRVPRSNVERLLWNHRVRQDIQLREYTDAELDQFLRDDELTPEARAIVEKLLANADRRRRKFVSQLEPEVRMFTDEEIAAFLEEDKISPEDQAIVERMLQDARAARGR